MFSQTWKKYLPVIAILIKRSATAEQTLSLNNTDFERAAGGRKIKFNFTHLQLNKGRINTEVKHSPVAKELSVILQEDDIIKRVIADQFLEFSLSNNFQLTIKNNTPAPETIIDPVLENSVPISEDETAAIKEDEPAAIVE